MTFSDKPINIDDFYAKLARYGSITLNNIKITDAEFLEFIMNMAHSDLRWEFNIIPKRKKRNVSTKKKSKN